MRGCFFCDDLHETGSPVLLEGSPFDKQVCVPGRPVWLGTREELGVASSQQEGDVLGTLAMRD